MNKQTPDLEILARVSVLDDQGAPVRLGDLWEVAPGEESREGPLLLVWLRHFG